MKAYISPSVDEISLTETATPGLGGSNAPVIRPDSTTDKDPVKEEWSKSLTYANHNSGSHSEVKFTCHNDGDKAGDNITFHVSLNTHSALKIKSFTPGDGCLVVTNQTATGFTLTRMNRHFNPGENVEFVTQIVFEKPDGTTGAAGTTGIDRVCDLQIVGFMAY